MSQSLKLLSAGFLAAVCSSPALAGWEVQWIDKFEGSSVNWVNWTAQTEANYNNEVQCYTNDDSSDERNYDVSDGTLKIIARKDPGTCSTLNDEYKQWTSGRLNSKDKQEFLYGRIESRIRFHNLEGGTWPAFWMLENRIAEQPIKGDDDTVNWPNPGAGEIDVWEWFANDPDYYITNFYNTGGCGSYTSYDYPNGSQDVLDWHRYAMEWTENQIDFYIDDTLVVSQDVSSCTQYEEPMFILLNLAMGGNLGGDIDSDLELATMEVDYVAHCQSSDDSDATYCDEDTLVSDDFSDSSSEDIGTASTPGDNDAFIAYSDQDDTFEMGYWGDTWSSGTNVAEVSDAPYSKAFELTSGTDWGGADFAVIAWGNDDQDDVEINSVDISSYSHARFKVKPESFTTVEVSVQSATQTESKLTYQLSSGTTLDDDWVEMEVTLPEGFDDMTWFGLMFSGSGTLQIADVYFVAGSSDGSDDSDATENTDSTTTSGADSSSESDSVSSSSSSGGSVNYLLLLMLGGIALLRRK